MRLCFGLFSILLGFTLPVYASEPKEIALHLAVVDHMAFSDAAVAEVDQFIRETLPQLNLKSLKVEASVFHSPHERLRQDLLKQLEAALGPTDRITHLIVDTHGDTRDGFTRLAVFGNFSADGGDSQLRELLAPLKGRLAPDVTIVLNSCSTLCGPDAADRVRGLLADLEAPDAQVYGSTTPEVERPGALLGRPQWRAYLGDLAQLKLFIVFGAALGAPFSYLSHAPLVTSVEVVSASLYAITTALKAGLAHLGAVNLGRLIVYRNGVAIENRSVEKYRARYEMYGTCRALFR